MVRERGNVVTKVSKIFEQLAELASAGDIKGLNVDQTRRVKFDINGAPLVDDLQTEPTYVVIKFSHGGKKTRKKSS